MKTGTAGIDQTTRKLADAMRLFFDLHKAAYGEDHIKPKHHWMLDIPPQLLRDGLVLDAFVIERQHLLVKNVANHIVNTRVFEASLGASVLTRQLQIAKEYRPGDKLVGKTSRLKDMAGVHIAEALEIYSIEFRANDVVSKGPEVGIIVACASDESSALFLFVAPFRRVAEVTPHAAHFRRTAGLILWRATDVRHCLAWRDQPGDVTLVLLE